MDTKLTMLQIAALADEAAKCDLEGALRRINQGRTLMILYGSAAMMRGEPLPLVRGIIKGSARKALGVRLVQAQPTQRQGGK